jgi:PAS domain S-box-containing protein
MPGDEAPGAVERVLGAGGAFAAVWEAASDAMAISDPDGVVLLANPAYSALYGYPNAAVVGRNFAAIFAPEQRADAEARYRAVFQGDDAPPGFEAVVRRADGAERVVDARYTFLLRDGRRAAMLSVVRDITERTQLEARLRDEVAATQRAVRARDTFLSAAAHELRTPLTALKGYAQLLAREAGAPVPRHGRLTERDGRLIRQISRLELLVEDLLDVAQLQAGRLGLRRERVDLAALARRVLDEQALTPARTARHALALEAAGPIWLEADPGRLEQVVVTLVSNALKYSPEGGEVRCAIWRDSDRAHLAVRDQGVGIAPEEQVSLFQPFARAGAADADGGIGLGLYLARELVERHGGSIALSSMPSQGTTVRVSLPLAAPERDDSSGT